jgi:hypothetical protein
MKGPTDDSQNRPMLLIPEHFPEGWEPKRSRYDDGYVLWSKPCATLKPVGVICTMI